MNDANKKLLKDCFQAVADAHTPSVGTHAAFFADILKERQRQLQLHPTSEDLPDGEIRGQIVPVPEAASAIMLALGITGLVVVGMKPA